MKKTRLLLLAMLLSVCTALLCWGSVSRVAHSAFAPDAAPHTEEQQPEISFTTAKQVGDRITLRIKSEGDFLVEGATLIDRFYKDNTPILQYKVDQQNITIKGDVTEFGCSNNKVVDLDVSKNTHLVVLYCEYNLLTSLDISKNTQLQGLYCDGNQLTKLDISKNTRLDMLYCLSNGLTSLDASKNTQLTDLVVSNNQLTNLKVPQSIKTLHCDYNELISLDVSKSTQLYMLSCSNNKLTSLDVSKNTRLGYLNCSWNEITSLNVSKSTQLDTLSCTANKLISLDISKNTQLQELFCDGNQLISLDVSQNTQLGALNCSSNQLTSLDMSKNTQLQVLDCSNNQLTSLDVSKNTELTGLYTGSNQLTNLKVSPNIETILCDDNQLTSLDVSKSTQLKMLYCSNNKLTSLDVSKNSLLEDLRCDDNAIKGAAMEQLVQSLPQTEQGIFCVFNSNGDENVITKSQVNIARNKGWETIFVRDYDGVDLSLPYLGIGNDRLSFTTNKAVGDSITFYVGIDSIGEGFRIAEGTQLSKSVKQEGKLHRFIYRIERPNQTFTIEGDIAQFICRNSGITSIESFRSDKARRMQHSHIRTLNAVNKVLATAQNLRVLDVAGNLLTAPSLQKNHILTSRRVPSSRARGVTILRQGGRTTKVVR